MDSSINAFIAQYCAAAVNYHCDSRGTRLNYEVAGQAVAAVRCSAPLDKHWKDAIEENFQN